MRELTKRNIEEGVFYYRSENENLFLRSKVVNSKKSFGITENILIDLECGSIYIDKSTEIIQVKRPKHLLIPFEWCYEIKDRNKEILGYIGKPNYKK